MSQRDKRGRDRQAPRKTHLCRAGACPRRWFCVVLPVFPVGAAPCGRTLPFDAMDVGRDHWARRPQGRVPDPPEVICPTPLSSYLLTSFDLRRGGLWPPAHSTLAFFTVEADTPVPLRGNSPSVLIGPYVLFWGISPPAGGEPLLERSKRGEKIAGGGHVGPYGPPMMATPGPPFTRGAWFGGWWKYTGAGWPLTPGPSPARCHCAAKPEGCLCYPFRRASPGASPWCGGQDRQQ